MEEIEVSLGEGHAIELELRKGTAHNHPLMAIWTEDTAGNYIETIFVARSIGSGIFEHGKSEKGQWMPGPVQRPAALPYWWHRLGYLPTPDNPVPDAVSGPTPQGDFRLKAYLPDSYPKQFHVLMEINQSWDWNEFWTNDRFPDNEAYISSSQPALVYRAALDMDKPGGGYSMKLIGHSHYAGEDGSLNANTESITTAASIAASIRIRVVD